MRPACLRSTLFALALLAACGGGGGGGSGGGQVAPSAELDVAERAYYFGLYAHAAKRVTLDCTASVQAAVRALHAGGLDRAAAEDLYAELRAALPVRRVRWEQGAPELLGDPGPLVLARGLERFLLVEVENRAAQQRAFTAYCADPRAGSEAETPVGLVRGVLTSVRADDLAQTHVELTVRADHALRTVHLPVRVVEPATLQGSVRDDLTGALVAARVTVRSSDGQRRHDALHGANPTLRVKKLLPGETQLVYSVPFTYVDGTFSIDVPPGKVVVTAERGFEHLPEKTTLELAPGETRAVALAPERIADLFAAGWVSGDTHVHWTKNSWYENEELATLALVQRAEDVRVVSNLTLRQLNESAGWEFIKPDHHPMGPVPGHAAGEFLIQMGEEYRNGPFYGHLSFLNLAASPANPSGLVPPISTGDPLGPFAEDWPTNRTAILEALAQTPASSRPIVLASHSIAGAGPADVVLGYLASIDQVAPEDYYRVLDCGLRVALTTGSDHPERLVGEPRCYVRIADPAALEYGAWIDGILAGASFTTSGPLLLLSADGVGVGGELGVASGASVMLRLEARSRRPLGRIELVTNGGVVLHSLETAERTAVIELPLVADASRWIVARCSAAAQPAWRPLDEPDCAHTSALYLLVDGAPIFVDSGAAEELRERCVAGGDYAYYVGTFHGPDAEMKRQEARAYFRAGADAYQALIDRRR
jgi:hypothetical protein